MRIAPPQARIGNFKKSPPIVFRNANSYYRRADAGGNHFFPLFTYLRASHLAETPAGAATPVGSRAPGPFDEATAGDIELQAGEMSLHDVYMIHGARPNTSTRRRTGVALRRNNFIVGHHG